MRVIFLAIGCAATLLATLYAKWLSVEHDVQGKIALILVDVQRDFMDDGPDGLATDRLDHTVRKGTLPDVESYSGLFDLGHTHPTGLVELLRARRVTTLVVAGVATDYCVLYTVLDALEEGFQVFLVLDGCAGISAEAVHAALDRMQAAGAVLVSLRGREGDHGAPSLLTELERARGKVHPGSQREL
ncbi:Pyrazinamidase/nicotinamidase [Auxenochlorella protothecoides]|uniref:nicotinamidase n=1 Tax=Auxenochlorella protothecoides TaxID=3075 RepID=A0A087SPZ0_AUXPR|nr:Pyrazinamidase/nicotinamidase [Auxenochlorella protothecoides]KFM27794.1 Pyrazinamidase/nicotinamidase [Auxenochlorella protothecoides]RMZ54452.1 hypothetical protein APUTEX25_002028 [Auxenochlorella protothecoides]|eukprot:RMZ54452.1 hypothetical protein APUTEX25_002028 [Auxenochlorella protothecoides]